MLNVAQRREIHRPIASDLACAPCSSPLQLERSNHFLGKATFTLGRFLMRLGTSSGAGTDGALLEEANARYALRQFAGAALVSGTESRVGTGGMVGPA
jgi:hypothetical protein